MIWPLLILACAPSKPEGGWAGDSADSWIGGTVPWSNSQMPTSEDVAPVRGWRVRRGIVHLHSPWSHDACDGEPLVDGQPDMDCLADLREGLCTTSMDFAYLTDHPTHAAEQPYQDLLFLQTGDEPVEVGGRAVANRIPCEQGNPVLWMPGIEDELMPVGLERHVAGDDTEENSRLYNSDSEEAIEADRAAGAFVLVAHTEGKDDTHLASLVEHGLQGVEVFNLHAMFDPNKRSDDLGLDAMGWVTDIAPFTSPDGTAEPDLLFLAVFQEQTVSVERWDALQSLGPVVGVAGTDAHQNVLPILMRDGERGDSYRRMLRWFSNHLLLDESVTTPGPVDYDEALASGRAYVAFEILGTPTGFDFHLTTEEDTTVEMGSTGTQGTLHLECPTLSAASPQGLDAPEIRATIFKNGQPWAEGCSDIDTDGPGTYRVRIDITPVHLREFLGEQPDGWIHSYPWVYSNPIRVH